MAELLDRDLRRVAPPPLVHLAEAPLANLLRHMVVIHHSPRLGMASKISLQEGFRSGLGLVAGEEGTRGISGRAPPAQPEWASHCPLQLLGRLDLHLAPAETPQNQGSFASKSLSPAPKS